MRGHEYKKIKEGNLPEKPVNTRLVAFLYSPFGWLFFIIWIGVFHHLDTMFSLILMR
jgi:hypothetical protein